MFDPITPVVRTAFDTGARLRHARFFHPRGIRLAGRFRAEPEFEELFGSGDRAVIARLSKGTGTPGTVPDILGLGFRVLARDEHPWDFALATTGRGMAGRFVVTPARGWSHARYGSLLPYRFPDSSLRWIFADPVGPQPGSAALGDLEQHLHEHPFDFEITAAGFRSHPRTVGELALRLADPEEHRTDFFDPMLNHPGNVQPVPQVVQRIREAAYTGSRRGRGAEDRETGRAIGTIPG
ncbi:beta/alpha barrel domain-containing protein [Nocardia carnea]|uniref:Phosphodiesterase n=2 Tax=Nocardia carnea TaxID=37328 RepID=A0ABW7TV27_9NOCA|nr:phosphodiesterase [Nocardia carnea]